jgi:integrin alpha FG-GAP repeat containing protein 1
LSHLEQFRYTPSYNITTSKDIQRFIPGDFNYDGHLDALVLTRMEEDDGGWWSKKNENLKGNLYLGGGPNGGFREQRLS